uniref:ATP synthase subunit a n=1 Tax=Cucullaea labiata TaxID=142556 RepID=A0A141AX74_9BIVA|nr:ATP synthase F0 subunit 6 [Cucullaea labiata]
MSSMVLSIFQIFDSGVSGGFSSSVLLWVVGAWFLFLIFFSSSAWGNRFFVVLEHLFSVFSKLYGRGGGSLVGLCHFLVSLCIIILFLNWGSLVPGVVGWTSQLVFPLMMGFSSWSALMVVGSFEDWEHVVGGFTPVGAPLVAVPFLVWVEVVSKVVRPITLSVRLLVNMVGGHLILSLCGVMVLLMMSASVVGWLFFCFFLMFVSLFEMVVCFLQAYVFGLLVGLYAEE